MTESTRDMLTEHVDNVAETVAEFARQIDAGEYGNRWTVSDDEGNEYATLANDEDQAHENAVLADSSGLTGDPGDWMVERDLFDEPTICDENGNETSIDDYPLSVEVKIGRPLAVVIGTGGPHIEIVQDLSGGSAKLAGYWGGEQVYCHGPEFQTVLDYFTDILWDEAPEEYK